MIKKTIYIYLFFILFSSFSISFNCANYTRFLEKHGLDYFYKWVHKDEAKKQELQKVMFTLVEVLRVTAIRLSPFMPFTAQAIWEQLGFADKVEKHSFSETEKPLQGLFVY